MNRKKNIALPSRDGVRKAKAQLENDIKGNKKSFYQCVSSKNN